MIRNMVIALVKVCANAGITLASDNYFDGKAQKRKEEEVREKYRVLESIANAGERSKVELKERENPDREVGQFLRTKSPALYTSLAKKAKE